MSSYRELIKNFEKIRSYMRDFYVYGFKSREDYGRSGGKSLRSYDDERRRIESWLGDYLLIEQTSDRKKVFLALDSLSAGRNPLYKAWKTSSFTDRDITLHFILFDILFSPEIRLSLTAILEIIDEVYLAGFAEPLLLDESTLRKKLKEYEEQGLILTEREGKKLLYRRAAELPVLSADDAINFFSEAAPCGVIGSFLLDREAPRDASRESIFSFKHHYITGALDSEVTAQLFAAMQEKRAVTLLNLGPRKKGEPRRVRLVPLRIRISVQSGRQHLIAYHPASKDLQALRIDYLTDVRLAEKEPGFDELRLLLTDRERFMWGVNTKHGRFGAEKTEQVSFTLQINPGEEYILRRLEREKRVGSVEKCGTNTYRFTAEVYDSLELIPWIRTFLCRIVDLKMSNKEAEERFYQDLEETYRIYNIKEEEKPCSSANSTPPTTAR